MEMELLPREKAKFLLAKGLVSGVENARDKSVVIENAIGLETVFSFIAQGMSDQEVRDLIGLDEKDFTFIFMGSPMMRRRYMEAKAFVLANMSQETLISSGLATSTRLEKAEKNAAEFHGRNIDRVLKSEEGAQGSTGVIVNNTVVVRDKGMHRSPEAGQNALVYAGGNHGRVGNYVGAFAQRRYTVSYGMGRKPQVVHVVEVRGRVDYALEHLQLVAAQPAYVVRRELGLNYGEAPRLYGFRRSELEFFHLAHMPSSIIRYTRPMFMLVRMPSARRSSCWSLYAAMSTPETF